MPWRKVLSTCSKENRTTKNFTRTSFCKMQNCQCLQQILVRFCFLYQVYQNLLLLIFASKFHQNNASFVHLQRRPSHCSISVPFSSTKFGLRIVQNSSKPKLQQTVIDTICCHMPWREVLPTCSKENKTTKNFTSTSLLLFPCTSFIFYPLIC